MKVLSDVGHALRLVRRDGVGVLVERGARAALRRVGDPIKDMGLRRADIRDTLVRAEIRGMGARPVVTIIMTPPGRDSGGHLTIMRLVKRLTHAGMHVNLAIYDIHGGRLSRHLMSISGLFPDVVMASADPARVSVSTTAAPPGGVTITDAVSGLPDSDVLMATSWQTAHMLARCRAAGRRFYLIQDFEPWFYPRGDANSFARSSYELGFHGLAIGRTLAREIEQQTSMVCESFPFGCEVSTADRVVNAAPDRRVTFYARPSTPRRGFVLGMCALEELQSRRPDVRIDIVGGSGAWPGIEAVWHGTVHPDQMSQLYQRSTVGLCLSFTNVSLVPFEMLAAGCPVVVNENPFSRGELSSPCVAHVSPDPQALAAALCEEIDGPHAERRPLARSSMCVQSWESAMDQAVAIISQHLPTPATTATAQDGR